ncbi:MAG: acetyl-CoA C-acetyltransferase [Candidatus Peregrinibacteria bacterium Greene0416_19]|nr:MAG: acetyl-CoA C-acetyltransferase [Candidatus Peregrinibacteria bacterium Greene0416_19]
MNQPIHLIGSGQTRFGEWWGKSLKDLMDEAANAALTGTPCTALDIDMIVVANMLAEVTNEQAHLGSMASSILPHHPPALRVESACGSGAFALHTACAFLESGRAQTVLVIGVEKMTDVSADDVSSALMGAADSEKDRPSGLTFPGIFGLIASRYMHEYGLTREDLSLVSAVHHRQAMENPFAQFRSSITPETVSRSPLIAHPLRLLDCSPVSDGAAAVVLSTKFVSPLRLAASQTSTDHLSVVDRLSLTSFPATQDACERALQESELHLADISALETHDCFSIAALINLEDLGFADPGDSIRVYRRLYEGETGPLSVNRSGGLKACGHPVSATGIKQLIDVGKQLTTTGDRFGMAHNFGGACATCAIHILENLDARSIL